MLKICTLWIIFLCDDTQGQKLHYDPIQSAPVTEEQGFAAGNRKHSENFAC